MGSKKIFHGPVADYEPYVLVFVKFTTNFADIGQILSIKKLKYILISAFQLSPTSKSFKKTPLL